MRTNSTYTLPSSTFDGTAPTFNNAAFPDAAGYGILRPFERDDKGDFLNGGAPAIIRTALGQVLGTRSGTGSRMGELRWRPEFGSALYRLRHGNLNAVLKELAEFYVVEAITRWEPRIRITRFDISIDERAEGNALTVRMKYVVVAGGKTYSLALGTSAGAEQEIVTEIR